MLTPEFLAKLEQHRIRCQQPFRGKFRGEHRSLNRGTGIEFADYRRYEPGDDLRYLDWNIYGRLGKLFIKLFQADEELAVSILIDTSLSMEFGTPTKLACAKQIAAAVGYIALANSERVLTYTFAERLVTTSRPAYGRSQFAQFQKTLTGIETGGTTDLATCLKQLATYQPKAGVAVILSDFLDPGGYADGIKALLGRGFALTLIHLQCPEEINPPPPGEWQLVDAETGEIKEITVNEETIEYYRNRQNDFCADLYRFSSQRGIGYTRINTDIDIEPFILQQLQHIGLIQRKH